MATPARTHSTQLDTQPSRAEELALSAFLLSKRNPNTRSAYRGDLLGFRGWLTSLKPGASVLTVSRPVLDLYREQLEARERYSPATAARKLAALASFYRYLVAQRQLDANPAAGLERPKTPAESPRSGLTRGEARKLILEAQQQGASASALVAALLYRGLRVTEALQLDTESFSKEAGVLSVRITRKGGKVSRVTFPGEAGELLSAALRRGSGPLVRGTLGGRLTRQSAARLVASLGRKIELGRALVPHDLRHAAITNLLDAGASLAEAQDFAGHASPVTTRRYDRHRRADTAAVKLAQYLAS
jgi:site-specific recombinase XerD